jgi:phosphate transport system permease protein
MAISRQKKELFMRMFFTLLGATGIIILTLILLFLVMEGMPIFSEVSVTDFLFGKYWYPTYDPPDFSVTIISSIIAIPLGVMTAVYLAEIATPRIRGIVKPIVELIEGLPTVVIGFFGMVVMAPFLQRVFDMPTGLNLFNASIMLAFMSVPTICSVSEDAIYSVPQEMKEASLALGATHLETIIRVILPASLSGISTAVILGISRAVGETMVVLMVAGGAAMIPGSLFDPIRPMPASIAAEMAEAPYQSEHYYSLFAIGLVLFVFTFAFNMLADYLAHKHKQVGAATL